MLSRCTLIFMLFLITGCAFADRRGLSVKQTEAIRIQSIHQFEGIYENDPEGYGPPLTYLIFPDQNSSIEHISVKAIDDSHLEISALIKSKTILQKVLTLGRDFEVSHSSVPLDTNIKTVSSRNSNAWFAPPHVGVRLISGEIYMNAEHDLIYHRSTTGGALVFFVVPFVSKGDDFGIYRKKKP